MGFCSMVNQHKTKVLNIFWLWLKLYLTIAIVAFLDSKLESQECNSNGKVLRQLSFNGSVAFLVLVTIGLLYVGFRKKHERRTC